MKEIYYIPNYAEGGQKKIEYDYDTGLYTWQDSRWNKRMIADNLRRLAQEIENQ